MLRWDHQRWLQRQQQQTQGPSSSSSSSSNHNQQHGEAAATGAAAAAAAAAAAEGVQWDVHKVSLLLSARGADMDAVLAAADTLRHRVCGDEVTYVVNRNINYTNVCTYGCKFCAFSKVSVCFLGGGRRKDSRRGDGCANIQNMDYPVQHLVLHTAARAAMAWHKYNFPAKMVKKSNDGGWHPLY
jgi:hypothetical protein